MISSSDEAWFWSCMIRSKTGCWLWRGRKNNKYGSVRIRGEFFNTHRLAYMLTRNIKLNTDQFVLHECDNKVCCNPFHLRLGTQKDNIRDSVIRGRNYCKSRTHCPYGHEYTEENTISNKGKRCCRACSRISNNLRKIQQRKDYLKRLRRWNS